MREGLKDRRHSKLYYNYVRMYEYNRKHVSRAYLVKDSTVLWPDNNHKVYFLKKYYYLSKTEERKVND